ncbi:MAG: HAMP domain-containing histidine kinase [Desulfuromonadales bacterium]|nr:HAMP domain-containing histidine kinase [Desulfuromonadales bacterium]
MKTIQIETDLRQTILAWTCITTAGEAVTRPAREGRLVAELLPSLLLHGRNPVAEVIASGHPLFLENLRLGCPLEEYPADVTIEPISGSPSGAITGARITLQIPDGCSFVKKLDSCQPLVDIGKSASMLAHGVRNPLNAIKGAIVYLKNHYRDESVFGEFAGIIEQEIASLDRFITTFLSASFEHFDRSLIDLNALLTKIRSVLALQAGAGDVQIVTVCQGFLPVQANPFLIEQALFNLLNNALTVSSPGARVVVRSEIETAPDGLFARMEIGDDGPGMPAEQIGEELTPGKGPHRGRGFGLFIAREVLQNHGGSLEIRSQQNRGTRVILRLPLAQEDFSAIPATP